jgi:DNA-binding transcriptional MerR regulator
MKDLIAGSEFGDWRACRAPSGEGVIMPEDQTAPPNIDPALKGIQEVSAQLKVTPRTLRFYEDKGLIEPQRVGNTRIYSKREIARMQVILRGKRLGFSIREIKEYLDLYDADPGHAEQNRLLLKRIRERLKLLEKQRIALNEMVAELTRLEAETQNTIATLTA